MDGLIYDVMTVELGVYEAENRVSVRAMAMDIYPKPAGTCRTAWKTIAGS